MRKIVFTLSLTYAFVGAILLKGYAQSITLTPGKSTFEHDELNSLDLKSTTTIPMRLSSTTNNYLITPFYTGENVWQGQVFAGFNGVGLNGQKLVSFWTNNNERFRITENGNVGIGITSPKYRLDLVSNSDTVAHFKSNNGIVNRLLFSTSGSGQLNTSHNGQLFSFGGTSATPGTLPIFGLGSNGSLWHMSEYDQNFYSQSNLVMWMHNSTVSINPPTTLGIPNETPKATFNVNGGISSSNLSGIGNRLVMADEEGILKTKDSEIISFGPAAIIAENQETTFIRNGVDIYITSTFATDELLLPINLPNGSKITQFKVYYVDNSSSKNVEVSLKNQVLGTNNSFATYERSSGSSPLNRNFVRDTNEVVDNALNTYFISFRAIDSSSNFGTSWPSSNLKINGVTITYEY